MNDELRYNGVFQEAFYAEPTLWGFPNMGMVIKGSHIHLCVTYPYRLMEQIVSVRKTDDVASLSLKLLTWLKNNHSYLRLMFPI
jgi:hypothetical protein